MIRPDAARPRSRLYRPFRDCGTEVARCFVLLFQGRRQAEGRAVERGGGRPTSLSSWAPASAKKVIPEENEPLRGVEGTAEAPAGLKG